MDESNYDSPDEYTSLMDAHVAETRTDTSGLVVEKRKRRLKAPANNEVSFSFNYYFKNVKKKKNYQLPLLLKIFLIRMEIYQKYV